LYRKTGEFNPHTANNDLLTDSAFKKAEKITRENKYFCRTMSTFALQADYDFF
jgi:hypothetical protein